MYLHPFPARMAPEIAFRALSSLPEESLVLDPMCGSGTVLQQALHFGHRAVGFDTDPLAVLMSRVSSQNIDPHKLVRTANRIADQAESKIEQSFELPWIDNDDETRAFISFWFGKEQAQVLRVLAYMANHNRDGLRNALRLVISKIIITKEPRASLARDTSHSRPHRVTMTSDYDVVQGFRRAATQIARQIEKNGLNGSATVRRRDARILPRQLNNQVDIVVTSPPYGNAIDYLRGHRLSLVWFGYTISQLRAIRNRGIGKESGLGIEQTPTLEELARQMGPIDTLEPATRLRLFLFTKDMQTVLGQIQRVLKPQGKAVLVIGNSTVKGTYLDNARLIEATAKEVGLTEISRYKREIPANHRYLPPPKPQGNQKLAKRMREEVVLTFEKVS